MTKTLKLKKAAIFTDIHFGKKSNSHEHNSDCIRFIEWFCDQVRADPEIDHVCFLGDWHENRSAINVSTLNYSYEGASKLNQLGVPVFHVVGNHDLTFRHNRKMHSVVMFDEFDNYQLINKPTIIRKTEVPVLMCPYLFHSEYPKLGKHVSVPVWMGHFEFKGFIVSGYSHKMPNGPDHHDFKTPTKIFSGHFHKRQHMDNVVYIGNTFPMDFSDAGDVNRGMATYRYADDDLAFINWDQCPKYIKTRLSDIVNDDSIIQYHSRVRCLVDIPITFEESNILREKFVKDYELREFMLEEPQDVKLAISDTESSIDMNNVHLAGVDELVMQMLDDIDTAHIKPELLIKIYKELTHD